MKEMKLKLKNKTTTELISLRLETKLLERIKQVCDSDEVSLSDGIRQMIEFYLDERASRNGKKIIDAHNLSDTK